jgi:predicted MFS family arabinose efflux permease
VYGDSVPVLIFVALVVSVIGSLGAPLITAVAETYDVQLVSAQWTLTLPLLVAAVLTPVLGRLGSGPHRRPTVLAALGAVVAGGVLTVLPLPFVFLLIGRGIQGVGLGLPALMMAIARDHLPPARATSTVALLSVTATAGIGVGYPLAGLLTDVGGVRLAYGLGLVAAVAALATAWWRIPPSPVGRSAEVDGVGAMLLGLALLVLLFLISQSAIWRSRGWLAAAGLAASAVLFTVWARYERRRPNPLVDLRLMRHPAVMGANLFWILGGAGVYLLHTMVTRFVQTPATAGYGFAATTFAAGLVLVPFSATGFLAGQFAPWLQRRIRPVLLLGGGSVMTASGFALFATERGHLALTATTTAVAGFGFGIMSAAMPAMILAETPPAETSVAMAANQVIRSIGLASGSALCGLVLAAATPVGGAYPSDAGYTAGAWLGVGLMLASLGLALAVAHRTRPALPSAA